MGTRNKQKPNFHKAFHEPGFSMPSLRCFKTEVVMSQLLSSRDPYLDCRVILHLEFGLRSVFLRKHPSFASKYMHRMSTVILILV